MLSRKDYLLLECDNVGRALKETLRYRYTESSTAEFYKECSFRLKSITALLASVAANDDAKLDAIEGQLSNLSVIVTCIERSHLEEFSWPFAYALRRISEGVCRQGSKHSEKPLFFFMAEGGMCSYAVLPDMSNSGVSERSIYSVNFPRTEKESVLLHAILGHEICHAALSAQSASLTPIMNTMMAGGVLSDPQRLYDWCRVNLGVKRPDGYTASRVWSWAQEIFCDLFGLIMMGPSFLPAFVTLLQESSPKRTYVPTHPPFAARAVSLLHFARVLGLLYSEDRNDDAGQLLKPLDDSFVQVASAWTGTAFEVLDHASLAEAAIDLRKFVDQYVDFAYEISSASTVAGLLRSLEAGVPPVASFPPPTHDDGGNIMLDEVPAIDFRDILLAGWLRWYRVPPNNPSLKDEFVNINNLCSHAILQQEAVVFRSSNDMRRKARTP